MNDSASFIGDDGVRYEVGVDGVNRHETLMARLPDGTFVRLDFPRNSLVPSATVIDPCDVGDEPVRSARVYVWNIEFSAFGRRYVVTVPEEESRLDESLAKLPDGRYVVLYNPLDTTDPTFEQIVLPADPLFVEAEAAGRIYVARLLS